MHFVGLVMPKIQVPGPRFNIKMSSYQYRKSHCGDKTVVRSSYLHNGNSYTGEMTFLYWIRPRPLPKATMNHFANVHIYGKPSLCWGVVGCKWTYLPSFKTIHFINTFKKIKASVAVYHICRDCIPSSHLWKVNVSCSQLIIVCWENMSPEVIRC